MKLVLSTLAAMMMVAPAFANEPAKTETTTPAAAEATHEAMPAHGDKKVAKAHKCKKGDAKCEAEAKAKTETK